LYRQALVLNQRLDNRVFQGINLVNLGTIAHRQRRHSDAVDFHRQSLAAFTELGKKPMTIYPLASMGNALVALGEFAQADDVFRRALKLCEENGDVPWTIVCLEGLAAVALGVGDGPNFGRRLGLGMQLRSQIGLPLSPSDAEEQAQFVHEAYERFGQDAVLQWKAEGRELGVNDVVGPRGN
jgi:tetratricopeptide (TPR) repeat protein